MSFAWTRRAALGGLLLTACSASSSTSPPGPPAPNADAGANQGEFARMDALLQTDAFLTAIINFVLVAFVLFLIIKAYEAMMARLKSSPEEAEPLTASEELLTEIRDLLRAQAR